MRLALLSALLGLSLTGACSKQSPPQTPSPPAEAEPAPPPAPAEEPTVASGEPAPAPAVAPGSRPDAFSDEFIAFVDMYIAGLEKMADGVVAAGTDCPKAAAAIRSMSGEMAALSERSKKLNPTKTDEAARKWFDETYFDKVARPSGKVMHSPCSGDKAVQEAMRTIKMP